MALQTPYTNEEMLALLARAANAAPAGYGLGAETPVTVNDLNSATKTGVYMYSVNAANAPTATGENLWVISYSAQYKLQRVFIYTSGATVQRRMNKGVWGEWEWVNPPMLLGVEYRTTERCEGKPVYAKRISYKPTVSITTGASVNIPHEISNFANLVRINARANKYVLPYVDQTGQQAGVTMVTETYIVFGTHGGTWGTNYTFYFDLYYTKTTD